MGNMFRCGSYKVHDPTNHFMTVILATKLRVYHSFAILYCSSSVFFTVQCTVFIFLIILNYECVSGMLWRSFLILLECSRSMWWWYTCFLPHSQYICVKHDIQGHIQKFPDVVNNGIYS